MPTYAATIDGLFIGDADDKEQMKRHVEKHLEQADAGDLNLTIERVDNRVKKNDRDNGMPTTSVEARE